MTRPACQAWHGRGRRLPDGRRARSPRASFRVRYATVIVRAVGSAAVPRPDDAGRLLCGTHARSYRISADRGGPWLVEPLEVRS